MANVALAEERLQHRRLRLLELQEERVVAVATEQEHDEGAGADAADTDDLASGVHVAVALEQLAPVARQRPAVGANHASEEVLEIVRALGPGEVLDRHDHGRVADDVRLAVHDLGQLRERLQAVLRACLGDARVVALYLLRGRLLEPLLRDLVDVDARIPERQVAHRGEPSDPLAVRLSHRPIDRLARLLVEAAVSAGDGEAHHEPLDVPLERSRQRLVEVVDAEYEPPVGRGEYAEVR